MDSNKKARQILNDIQYATIATTDSDGRPWNTPVFYASDQHANVYWSSHPISVHSKNIGSSGRAFIVIYNPMAKNGEGQGLYLETSVTMLSELDEINNALDLLGKRRGKPFGFVEKFTGNGSQRIYKATPEKMWINDADQDADGDFIRDYRIEVQNFRET